MRKVLLAAALLAMSFGAAGAAVVWATFTDPSGALHADMPGSPVSGHIAKKTADGKDTDTLVYISTLGAYQLVLGNADFSQFSIVPEPARALDNAVRGGQTATNAAILSDAPLNLDGQTGRRVVMVGPDGTRYEAMIFFVKGHLYEAAAVGPKETDAATDDALKRFFDSFHLTAP